MNFLDLFIFLNLLNFFFFLIVDLFCYWKNCTKQFKARKTNSIFIPFIFIPWVRLFVQDRSVIFVLVLTHKLMLLAWTIQNRIVSLLVDDFQVLTFIWFWHLPHLWMGIDARTATIWSNCVWRQIDSLFSKIKFNPWISICRISCVLIKTMIIDAIRFLFKKIRDWISPPPETST